MRRYLVALVVGAIVGYFLFGNPDITLRSSDGKWADNEIQFKGRHFEDLVWNFEGYKLKCVAPGAVLLRATPEYWFNIFAWPSYLSNRKWRPPYSDAHSEIGSYYPPDNVTGCFNDGWSPEILKKTDVNAARYLGTHFP